MKYALIGSGGTGTHVLFPLSHYLSVYHRDNDYVLLVIDGDVVEEKNLSRQLFDTEHIAINKAIAAVSKLDENLPIIPINEYLTADNIGRFIEDGTVVLIAVDNFPVRALIEEHCKSLDNVVVINGGNEFDTGSCQVWIRKDGVNITPPISFLHPEILAPGLNRAEMSCTQVAALDGGEQLIVTNMASAMWMLMALIKVHNEEVNWTEIHFDLSKGEMTADDYRDLMPI